jgi:pimeloyl-ACP methyl ester carboxylesterase
MRHAAFDSEKRAAPKCRVRKFRVPVITVPAITMEGDSNGAIHAPATAYRNKFSGKYEYRLISGGIGHNLPQEAPQAFAQAVIDVDGF